ncbi:hypothetical protein PPL_10818 [Heterostelium album PN500]|uniref:F-box domain-containing protein n=1 Tax=Heterostelium pallidum (strain ATCC 26659 / Pp 5 / PN500) TaxID=670386 RepID=D3BS26_HETP5|nr:hypothetical protein PPL_10818 [Heterostelium album PN500]EFA75763.1 hypothetical protein PPL_10818 [Heterostelium album PN500]|eukprot:XP_020427897.1 hypothetical protein PPL_10818 [Heterostelium album PN500]
MSSDKKLFVTLVVLNVLMLVSVVIAISTDWYHIKSDYDILATDIETTYNLFFNYVETTYGSKAYYLDYMDNNTSKLFVAIGVFQFLAGISLVVSFTALNMSNRKCTKSSFLFGITASFQCEDNAIDFSGFCTKFAGSYDVGIIDVSWGPSVGWGFGIVSFFFSFINVIVVFRRAKHLEHHCHAHGGYTQVTVTAPPVYYQQQQPQYQQPYQPQYQQQQGHNQKTFFHFIIHPKMSNNNNNSTHKLVNLPHILLSNIVYNLTDNIDQICFSLVCKRWFEDRNRYLLFDTNTLYCIDKHSSKITLNSYRSIISESLSKKKQCSMIVIPYMYGNVGNYDHLLDPDSIESIDEIDQSINSLPSSVKTLDIHNMNGFKRPGTIPNTVNHLTIRDHRSDFVIAEGVLPDSIQNIKLKQLLFPITKMVDNISFETYDDNKCSIRKLDDQYYIVFGHQKNIGFIASLFHKSMFLDKVNVVKILNSNH